MKSGKYAKHFKSRPLRDVYETYREDPEVKDLRDEVGVLRTFVAAALEKISDEESLASLSSTKMAVVMSMISEVKATVAELAKLEQKINVVLSVQDVNMLIAQIADIIGKYVTDDQVLAAIAEELEGLRVGDLGPEATD